MEFLMVCGLPGSGKSYFTQSYKDTHVILSSDDIREELGITEQDSKSHALVFEELHKRMVNNIREGNNVLYDATNLSSKRRLNALRMVDKFNPYKRITVIATPVSKCLENNANRDRQVPKYVIYDMAKAFEFPFKFEGWDDVEVYYPFEVIGYDIAEDLSGEMYNFDQNNQHHTLTVRDHMSKCADLIVKQTENPSVCVAAALHDIGKLWTKTFKNTKGEITEEAHYYGHENRSVYECLFYEKYFLSGDCKEEESRLISIEVLFYIQNHMKAHQFHTMKSITRQKYKDLWSEERYNNLLLLAEADMMAK